MPLARRRVRGYPPLSMDTNVASNSPWNKPAAAEPSFALNPIALQPLSPGQVLVIHTKLPLSPLERDRLTRQLKVLLRGHNNPLVFLDGDLQIGIANPKAPETLFHQKP